MRLLLDAHVSGPNVGRRLEGNGHDVRALDQEPALKGLDDDDVLALATSEQRILVTTTSPTFRGSCATGPPHNARMPESSSSTASTTANSH